MCLVFIYFNRIPKSLSFHILGSILLSSVYLCNMVNAGSSNTENVHFCIGNRISKLIWLPGSSTVPVAVFGDIVWLFSEHLAQFRGFCSPVPDQVLVGFFSLSSDSDSQTVCGNLLGGKLTSHC